MNKRMLGFSMLELLVTLAIIGILVTITIVGLTDSRAKTQDAKRQADLRLVATAVELFKNKYGHYPTGCNASTTAYVAGEAGWSGEEGTGFECAAGNEYIINLAPEFIPALPRDPRAGAGGVDSGYVYTTNNEGSVYKFMALNTVQDEVVDQFHEFYRCDPNSVILGGAGATNSWDEPGICNRSYSSSAGGTAANRITLNAAFNSIPSCEVGFENDYAVSAGFSSDARGRTGITEPKGREFDTEIVRCK